MPFDMNDPKPPEIYETPQGRRRRYWPYPNSIENLDYTPKEIRSWGSVVTLPEIGNIPEALKCNGKCVDKPIDRHYPENYLHEQVMLDNPSVLVALKNTPIIRHVPDAPLEFIPPHFVHKSKRNRFHLVLPQTYRTALCKITDNLYKDHAIQKQVLGTRKGRGAASSIPSKTESSVHVGSKSLINENSLTYIAKSEGLLKYVRRKVEVELETQERKDLDKRFFPSDVEFDKNFHNKVPHMERYHWDKQGGMQALCVEYPGLSVFNESPSEIPAVLKASEEISNKSILRSNKEVLHRIPADMMKLFLNAPSYRLTSPATNPDQFKQFSHYGLLETAKADALETCLKKLYRREREIKLPHQLMNNAYGPLKGMPSGYQFQRPHLPEHLDTDCPPQAGELVKVERVMKNEKKARKSRKARGVQSVEPVSRVIGQFSKPIIESSENEELTTLRKSAMTLDDYPKKRNELNKRDSSDSLFCHIGAVKMEQEHNEASHPAFTRQRKKTWLVDIMAKSSAALAKHKALWQEQLEPGKGKLRVVPTVADMSSSSLTNSEEDEDEDHREERLRKIKDSRESLPYPDVTFSAIRVPSDVADIGDTWLYRKLTEDQRSLSSSDSNVAIDGEFEEDEDEAEEQDENTVEGEKSDTAFALDKMFKNIQPLLTRSNRIGSTASEKLTAKWSSNVN